MKMTKISSTALAIGALLLGTASTNAAIIVNVLEDSGNVVFTFSGSIAVNSLPLSSGSGLTAGISAFGLDPSATVGTALLNFAFEPPGTHYDSFFVPVTGSLPPFGSSTFSGTANSSTGDYFYFAVDGASAQIVLPTLYTGAALSGSMTYDGKSFADLGLVAGAYEWSWTNSTNGSTDTVTFNVPATVPDAASTLALLGGAVLALGTYRRRFAR